MIAIEDIQKKLESLALPLAQQLQLELIEIGVHMQGSDAHIEILTDRPEGGITIEECATLNRSVAEAIDADGFLGENYTLGVSSPGLDRPLKTAKDFSRRVDCAIHFWLTKAVEGKQEYTGILTAMDAAALTVSLAKKKTVVLPMASIEKGLLVI